MSTFVKALKKQIEMLQAEVELYASAVDSLAERLAEAQNELQAHAQSAPDHSPEMAPVIEHDAAGHVPADNTKPKRKPASPSK